MSFMYLLARWLMQLLAFCFHSRASQALEMVLRHQLEILRLGIIYKHSRPYHPETCGKVERFHQTLKRYLDKQPKPDTIGQTGIRDRRCWSNASSHPSNPVKILKTRPAAEYFSRLSPLLPALKGPVGSVALDVGLHFLSSTRELLRPL